MKIIGTNQYANFTSYYPKPVTLKEEVMRIGDIDKVRELYGQIGVDIFKSKGKISILSETADTGQNSILQKIKKILDLHKTEIKYDYDENDTLSDVMLKYMSNEKSGTYTDIQSKFGKLGVDQMDTFKAMGYASTSTSNPVK